MTSSKRARQSIHKSPDPQASRKDRRSQVSEGKERELPLQEDHQGEIASPLAESMDDYEDEDERSPEPPQAVQQHTTQGCMKCRYTDAENQWAMDYNDWLLLQDPTRALLDDTYLPHFTAPSLTIAPPMGRAPLRAKLVFKHHRTKTTMPQKTLGLNIF
ncbi:hypothetical protein FRB98_001711 [Tulasnella sp. 332]|nr:hypothetical protein FRB98_001711 [Tulasnella sp. 332]